MRVLRGVVYKINSRGPRTEPDVGDRLRDCRTANLHTRNTSVTIFTALHGMQTRSGDENSARLSVRLSVKRVLCDKIVERSVHIFTSYERSFSLVF